MLLSLLHSQGCVGLRTLMLHNKDCALWSMVCLVKQRYGRMLVTAAIALCLLSSLCVFVVLSFPSARYRHTLHTSKKEAVQPMSSRVNPIHSCCLHISCPEGFRAAESRFSSW